MERSPAGNIICTDKYGQIRTNTDDPNQKNQSGYLLCDYSEFTGMTVFKFFAEFSDIPLLFA